MILEFLQQLILCRLNVDYNVAFPPSLSKEEELEYFKKMENNDENAKNKLIEHNLRLVAHIIKKYYGSGESQDEMISIGTIGLIKAVTTFDYKKGSKFATYASRCIENEILMNFRSRKKFSKDISIFDPIDTDKDGNQMTLLDVIEDENLVDIAVENSINSEVLRDYIKKYLTTREADIITMRYGLLGNIEMPQREVAQKLNISRSYVSRIEKKALEKLRLAYEGKE
jgi:RNA polymerase sporulation-specific sigma factor